jgi:addiction module HigA family antidote
MAKSQTPAATLKNFLDEYQVTPTKLAKEISLSQSAVRQITIGQTKITVPTALRLAKYFGTTPEYWIDLQNNYDLSQAAKDSELTAILKAIPKAKKSAPAKRPKGVPAKKAARAGTR